MVLRLYLLEYLGDSATPIDDEGRASDPFACRAERRLIDPDAVRFGNRMVLIGQQRIEQLVFGLELPVRGRRIRTGAKDHRIDSLEPREGVSKRARLDGSPGGVVFGIEEQHHDLSAQGREL